MKISNEKLETILLVICNIAVSVIVGWFIILMTMIIASVKK